MDHPDLTISNFMEKPLVYKGLIQEKRFKIQEPLKDSPIVFKDDKFMKDNDLHFIYPSFKQPCGLNSL